VSSCTNSDLTKWIDANPAGSLKILKYLVSCALPSGVTVRVNYRGTLYSYTGLVGLGPSIRTGVMTSADQESVSACLLARVNGQALSITIDITGPMAGINGALTASDLTLGGTNEADHEAVFFGNVFTNPPQAYMAGLPPVG